MANQISLAPSASTVPTLSELNQMLDTVRSIEAGLMTSLDHMNKALKKMMKTGQWRKEWNRTISKDTAPKSEHKAAQLDLVSKIQAVRQEMAAVRSKFT